MHHIVAGKATSEMDSPARFTFFTRCSWTEGLLGAAMLNRCDGGQICTTSSLKARNAPEGMVGKGRVQLQAMYKYLHCVRGAYRSLKPKDCGANHSSALLHLQKRICASCVTASSVGLEVRQQGGVAPRPCKNKDQRTATSRPSSCMRRPISLLSQQYRDPSFVSAIYGL